MAWTSTGNERISLILVLFANPCVLQKNIIFKYMRKGNTCCFLVQFLFNLKWEVISNIYLNNTLFPKILFIHNVCIWCPHCPSIPPLSSSMVQKIALWRLHSLYEHAHLMCSNFHIAECLVRILVYLTVCCVLAFYNFTTKDHKLSSSIHLLAQFWWLSRASAWDHSRWDQGRLSPGIPGQEWNPVPCGHGTQGPLSSLAVGQVLLLDPQGHLHLRGLLTLQQSTVQQNLFMLQLHLSFLPPTKESSLLLRAFVRSGVPGDISNRTAGSGGYISSQSQVWRLEVMDSLVRGSFRILSTNVFPSFHH